MGTRPKYIYHCVTAPISESHIEPRPLLNTTYFEELKDKFQEYAITDKSLIYAVSSFEKALSHAFNKTFGEVLLRATARVNKQPIEIVVICNRTKAMTVERDSRIYRVPAKSFIPLNGKEWITNKKIDLNKCAPAYLVKNSTDILQGLQVFSVNMTPAETKENGLLEFFESKTLKERLISFLGNLTQDGLLKWENLENQINVNDELFKALRFSTEDLTQEQKFKKKIPQWLSKLAAQKH